MVSFDRVKRLTVGDMLDDAEDAATVVAPTDRLKDAAAKALEDSTSSVVVRDEDKVTGVLTQSDFQTALASGLGPDATVAELLDQKSTPALLIDSNLLLTDLAQTMGNRSTVVVSRGSKTYSIKRDALADRVERNLL